MSIISKMRKQSAIFWSRSGTDGYGRPTWNSPVQIECRWEDLAEEYINYRGTREVSKSTVYVDRVMDPGGYLKLGSLDSGISNDPTEEDDAWEIKSFRQVPNLKATETLLSCML